jgi:hypothetical protein
VQLKPQAPRPIHPCHPLSLNGATLHCPAPPIQQVHDQGKTTRLLIRSQNLLRWMEQRTTRSILAQVSYLLDYRLAGRKSNIYQKREGDPDDEPSCERTESIITFPHSDEHPNLKAAQASTSHVPSQVPQESWLHCSPTIQLKTSDCYELMIGLLLHGPFGHVPFKLRHGFPGGQRLIGLISLSNRYTIPHATSLVGFGNLETIPAWEQLKLFCVFGTPRAVPYCTKIQHYWFPTRPWRRVRPLDHYPVRWL